MAGFSDYLEDKVLDHVFGGTSFTAPSGSVIFIMFELLFCIIERTKIISCIDATIPTYYIYMDIPHMTKWI